MLLLAGVAQCAMRNPSQQQLRWTTPECSYSDMLLMMDENIARNM